MSYGKSLIEEMRETANKMNTVMDNMSNMLPTAKEGKCLIRNEELQKKLYEVADDFYDVICQDEKGYYYKINKVIFVENKQIENQGTIVIKLKYP